MTALEAGTRVRFTFDNLGTQSRFDSTRFEPEIVNSGDEGRYLQPHPGERMPDDWHFVEVVIEGRTLYVACHATQFEVVS